MTTDPATMEAARRFVGLYESGDAIESRFRGDYWTFVFSLALLAAEADKRELNAAILELQRDACARAGVPMPSERSVVDKLRDQLAAAEADNERLREALREICSQCHNLPRTATADRIAALAAALGPGGENDAAEATTGGEGGASSTGGAYE